MQKSWKIIIVVILIVLVVREFLPTNFSFYQSNSKTELSNNNTFRSWKLNRLKGDNNFISLDENKLPKINFYGFDDEVNTLNKNKKEINVIIKNDSDISLTRFIPLVKPIEFSSNIQYSWDCRIYKNDSITTIESSGSVLVSGSKKIYGICTGKEAKKLIILKIKEDVKEKVKSEIRKTLKSFGNK